MDRRVSSSVFNPSGEDARASSSKNLNGARSAQDLLPAQMATSSVKRLVDIQLYAPPPVARGEIENYSQLAASRTYQAVPEQEPQLNASADSQRNAYEVDVGCEEEMEDEQNEYRRAGSRYSQPDNDEDAEGEEEEQEDEINE